MQLVVTNVSAAPVYLADLYSTIQPGASITTTRAESDLSRMASLQAAIAAGTITIAATPTAAELASGMLVGAGGASSGVTSTTAVGEDFDIRKVFTAGAGGSADDVTIYAAGAVPFKFRVLDIEALISTAVATSTVQARTAAAGGGTLLQEVAGTPAGHQDATATVTATQVVTPGPSVGLFLHRSDSGIAGEVILHCRREQ